jgi:hypothetical protein
VSCIRDAIACVLQLTYIGAPAPCRSRLCGFYLRASSPRPGAAPGPACSTGQHPPRKSHCLDHQGGHLEGKAEERFRQSRTFISGTLPQERATWDAPRIARLWRGASLVHARPELHTRLCNHRSADAGCRGLPLFRNSENDVHGFSVRGRSPPGRASTRFRNRKEIVRQLDFFLGCHWFATLLS